MEIGGRLWGVVGYGVADVIKHNFKPSVRLGLFKWTLHCPQPSPLSREHARRLLFMGRVSCLKSVSNQEARVADDARCLLQDRLRRSLNCLEGLIRT